MATSEIFSTCVAENAPPLTLADPSCSCSTFLDDKSGPESTTHQLIIRKDLLDDSNAAKEEVGCTCTSLQHIT